MNGIRCLNCGDILVPMVYVGKQKCWCESIEMRAVHPDEKLPYLVEVKLSTYIKTMEDKTEYTAKAQVIKINNHFLSGEMDYHEFTGIEDSLFYKNQSQIVIAPLDTPGVKVVKEFTNELK